MDTLKCTKLQFHTFAEKQGWLLLFDEVSDTGSKIGYMLPSGSTIFVVFDTDGNFDHMNDTTAATIEINPNENRSENDDD
jgi:hypothetical protein